MDSKSPPEPLLLSVLDAASVIGISRATMFKLLKAGSVQAVKLGRRTLIPMQSLRDYVADLPLLEPAPEGMRKPELRGAETPEFDLATAFVGMQDAARFLGCGRTTLYSLIANGCVLAAKQGRRTLIRRRSLEAYAANLANVSCA
jgi:excisionase family DNA binding protein